MRVIGVCSFLNEADIIEAFARHWLVLCDQLILLDHGSADESADIVRKLQREGLPIHLVSDTSLGHLEMCHTNRLLKLAAHDFSADWIFCIDADEFLDGVTEMSFLPPPGSEPHACRKLKMRTYYPHPSDDLNQLNVTERITHRLVTEPQRQETFVSYKVVVPGELARKEGGLVVQGKHQFFIDSAETPFEIVEDAWLAHFSLRTPGQYATKIVCRQLQKFRHIGSGGDTLDYYDQPYNALQQSFSRLSREFHDLNVAYAPADADKSLVSSPFQYRGGPLRYTAISNDADIFIRNLLAMSERLARSHSPAPDSKNATGSQPATTIFFEIVSHPIAGGQQMQSTQSASGSSQMVDLPLDCPAGTEEIHLTIRGTAGFMEIEEISLHYTTAEDDRTFTAGSLKPMLRMIEGGLVAADGTKFRLYLSSYPARLKFQGWKVMEDLFPKSITFKFRYEDRFQPETFLSMPVLHAIATEQRQAESDGRELARLGTVARTMPARGSSTIDFTSVGNREFFIGQGWSFAEPWGSWTDGSRATFSVRFSSPPACGLRLRIAARGFPRRKQKVSAGVNGQVISSFVVTAERFKVFEVKIPLEKLPGQTCEFFLDVDDPKSPLELGLSSDDRRLGIGIERIELEWMGAC